MFFMLHFSKIQISRMILETNPPLSCPPGLNSFFMQPLRHPFFLCPNGKYRPGPFQPASNVAKHRTCLAWEPRSCPLLPPIWVPRSFSPLSNTADKLYKRQAKLCGTLLSHVQRQELQSWRGAVVMNSQHQVLLPLRQQSSFGSIRLPRDAETMDGK